MNAPRGYPLLLTALALSLAGLSACDDGGSKKRPLGATCDESSECLSGLCAEGRCIDPDGDEDVDGISNGLEVELLTNPFDPDTDADDKGDRDELEPDFSPRDTDADGTIDALESALLDPDFDCLSDEVDRREQIPDGADSDRLAELCPAPTGACAADGASLRVMCPDGMDAPICDFAEVPGYEATEATCDAVDNDCDGAVDEVCDPLSVGLLGHWPLDGDGQDVGPHGDHGAVTGARPTTDRFGHPAAALHFARGDRVHMPSTHHPLGDVTATYSVWVRPDRGADGRLGVFAFGETAALKKSALVLAGDRRCTAYVGAGREATSLAVCAPAAHWSHLVLVKEGRTLSLWLDGRPHETGPLAPGQDFDTTSLLVGLAGLASDGAAPDSPFAGAIDDLRVWNRALTQAEIDTLFFEGGWTPAGTAAHPAQSCHHLRDAGRDPSGASPATGSYPVDVDGDGARAPFNVHCDMDLDGGGWTLAWVYEFTDFDAFESEANAVTPIPSWPVASVTVPVSTSPPPSPTTPGAIDWSVWKDLGRAFVVVTDLADGIACEPGAGSIADGLDGWVDCRTVVDVTQTCEGVVPTGLFFGKFGPSLYARDLYYYFDGNEDGNWPTHDPCGENSPQHVASPARRGGAIYLRDTARELQWPAQCDWVSGLARESGPRRIDPDGLGGLPAFDVSCDFDLERGGWTLVTDAMRASMAARPDVPREVLFQHDDHFYRSPHVTAPWSDDFVEAAGRWVYRGAAGDGVLECAGGTTDASGIGCVDPARGGVAPESPLADGKVTLCQSPPDAFGVGDACVETTVWVREHGCVPDQGSLLGDGALDVVAAADGSWQSPCWYAWGPGGWLDAFTTSTDVPPGGTAPSLEVMNPTLGNDLWEVELGQRAVTLIAGRSYTLSFWARAAEPRTIRAFIQSSDLVYVHHEDLALTTTWTRFAVAFTAETTMWDAMVSLQLGETSTATVWLDGFALTEGPPAP